MNAGKPTLNPDKLSAIYYKGTGGPTILMISKAERTIGILWEIIRKLASGEESDIVLHDCEHVELHGISSFVLQVDNNLRKEESKDVNNDQ